MGRKPRAAKRTKKVIGIMPNQSDTSVVKVPKDMPPTLLGTSLESEEWLKIVYLKRKGYSHEEALRLVEKLAAGEIQDVRNIPIKEV